jgi:hypothetical protein
MSERKPPRNPLISNEEYDKLFDDDLVSLEELEEGDSEFEPLSYGGRRRKPQINPDF